MPEEIDNYRSQTLIAAMRWQAWKAWAVTLAVIGVWVLLIVSPPIFGASGMSNAAESVFAFFGNVCHQIPDRSFHMLGHQFGVCSRCFGVYLGLFAGVAVYPLWRRIEEVEPLSRIWLFLSLVPISVDWALTFFEIWENTQLTRFVTGLILGVACATFILPAIVEITRNLTHRLGAGDANFR